MPDVNTKATPLTFTRTFRSVGSSLTEQRAIYDVSVAERSEQLSLSSAG